MARKIVGLVGLARSGKDTVARFLTDFHGFDSRRAFADPLKEAAIAAFNLNYNQVHGINYDREQILPFWDISVREILQKLGTESIRDVFGDDHWVKLMQGKIERFPNSNVVITDVRFDNEVEMIRSFGGSIIGVVKTEDQPNVREHVSEEMAANRLDEVADDIIHASNLDQLREEVNRLFGEGASVS